MKTTVEIPDRLFREAKAAAAKDGLSLKTFLTQALTQKLAGPAEGKSKGPSTPGHMNGFGTMRRRHTETKRIQKRIDGEFSRIDPEDWK